MEDQLWSLFRETGDPMGYLLYKAEGGQKENPPKNPLKQPREGKNNSPSASM